MKNFNQLHPTHAEREKGWKSEPNPFTPKPPRAGHGYYDKHIFVYANQLWYDIDATTSMLGRARRGSQASQEDNVPTNERDKERPLFYRWFDKYLKKTEVLLSAYIVKPEGRVRDNALKEWQEKDVWLRMPDCWDDSRYDALAKAIHDYIVAGALYEYFAITLTSKDPLTVDKASEIEDAELEITGAVNATKPGSLIRSLKPFG